MKRPAILLAILLLASPLYAALKHTNTVYLNGSWPQFHVEKSLYETEEEWFYCYESEQSTTPTNMTGWTALYYYSNVSDPGATTVPMRIMTGTVSTTYITFTPSATEFSSVIQGGYAALVFVKGDERITFARGKHTTLPSPENQTGVSFDGMMNVNWASFGTYSHTSTHGPVRPDGTTITAVTNADGSLTFTSVGGSGSGTITNMLSADGSIAWTDSGGPQPDGSVTGYVAGVVAGYVPTNDAALTNAEALAGTALQPADTNGWETGSHADFVTDSDTNGWETGSHAAMVLTNTPTYTDTVAKAGAAYPASNPSNFLTDASTWYLHPADGTVDICANVITNVLEIHGAAEGERMVLNETFATDPFVSRWTNLTAEAWSWDTPGYILTETTGILSNVSMSSVVSGRTYRVIVDADYGYDSGGQIADLAVSLGGQSYTLTNAAWSRFTTTNEVTATSDAKVELQYVTLVGGPIMAFYSIRVTDLTPEALIIPYLETYELVVGAGVTNITTNATSTATDEIPTCSAMAEAITAVEADVLRTWMTCNLDIDPTAAGGWTDFEIKFSTNNFTNLVYYYKSTGTNAHQEAGLYTDDYDPYVYYTLSCGHTNGETDVRFWHKQVPHDAILNTLADPTNGVVGGIEFWPSHSVQYPTTNWCWETNVLLVGSWVRIDSLAPEYDGASNQVWRPVAIDWRTERRTR